MARRRPPSRVTPVRSRNNQKRRLRTVAPTPNERSDLAARAVYGAYSKHKFNPSAYRLQPYAGTDVERTYCDEHAKFKFSDIRRALPLLKRGIHLGLWAEGTGDPRILWTIDDNGWIYELRMTNAGQAQYHGYPVLPGDAFSHKVLTRARHETSAAGGFALNDPDIHMAILAAGNFYR